MIPCPPGHSPKAGIEGSEWVETGGVEDTQPKDVVLFISPNQPVYDTVNPPSGLVHHKAATPSHMYNSHHLSPVRSVKTKGKHIYLGRKRNSPSFGKETKPESITNTSSAKRVWEAGMKGWGQERKVMLLSLALDRFWTGVLDTSCNMPHPCPNASQTIHLLLPIVWQRWGRWWQPELWGKENDLVFEILEDMWWSLLGLDDINKLLPEGQASLVPAAGAINMLHADIVPGLVPIELPFQ